MSDKALVIISTGEADKALTGLMWAHNAMLHGWMEDIKVIFFGPAQDLPLVDERIREKAQEIAKAEKPVFCKFISDRDGKSEQLEEIGMEVNYVGALISKLTKDGYVPMVY